MTPSETVESNKFAMVPRFTKFAAALFFILGLLTSVIWDISKASTPHAPLAELLPIELGGQLHYASIRSRIADENKLKSAPVLLILHGGPGASDIPFISHTDGLLEEYFIVVHYDQRSAGKSCRFYNESSSFEDLTIQQHVTDAVDMVEYLRRRFHREKIHVLGGSWGTILALLLARDYPHLFHHVATRGLVVNPEESERLSNEFILSRLPDFEGKVNPPPYDNRYKDLVAQRSWLYRAGGMSYHCMLPQNKCSKHDLSLKFVKSILQSPEMSWADTFRFRRCFMTTLERMWPQVQQYKADEDVKKLDVPLLVLHGRHDHCTDAALVPSFVKGLNATTKRLVWFEKSAHSPQMEEPDKFQRTIIEEFLGISFPAAEKFS